MVKALTLLLTFSILIMLISCKKGNDPAATADEYLTCTIDGQTFTGTSVKPSTGDYYAGSASGEGTNTLKLVFGDASNTFYILINNFTKQAGTFTLDGRNGKLGGYALFKQDDGKAQWTNTSNITVSVTSYNNDVIEGKFAFTLPGPTNKVFTNGKFRSKIVIH